MGRPLHPFHRRLLGEIADGGFGPGFGLIGIEHGLDGQGRSLLDLREQLLSEEDKLTAAVPFCDWGCGVWIFVDGATGRVLTLDYHGLTDTGHDLAPWMMRWASGEDLTANMFEMIETTAINPFTRKPMIVRGRGRARGVPHRRS